MDSTKRLLPLSPNAVVFTMAFLAVGVYFILTSFTSGTGLFGLALGIFMIYAAFSYAPGYMVVTDSSLVAWGRWSNHFGGKARIEHFPTKLGLAFNDMEKISLMSIRSGRANSTGGLFITMKDGSTHALVLTPYRVKDLRIVVQILRQAGLNVYIEPRLLGKDFK